MSNKMWESLVEHAKTCVLSGKHYVYYQDDSRSVGVLFNNIYELRGLIAGDQYYPAESLDESQKVITMQQFLVLFCCIKFLGCACYIFFIVLTIITFLYG